VWFEPNTLTLYVVDGHTLEGNGDSRVMKCNRKVLTLQKGKTYTLKMRFLRRAVSVWVNGKVACSNIPREDRRVFKGVKVYASDPWYTPANAAVSGLYLKNLPKSGATGHADKICPVQGGFCVKSNGQDQNAGVLKLDSIDGKSQVAKGNCIQKCLGYGLQNPKKKVTGCEIIWDQGNRGCYVHTNDVSKGNKVKNHACWIFSKCMFLNPKVPKGAKLLGGDGIIEKGKKLKPVDVPLDYEIGFTLAVSAIASLKGWRNILHLTASGKNCCNYGDRIPGVWFQPNTLTLYIVDGHAQEGNSDTLKM
jgi:hypothetical protein